MKTIIHINSVPELAEAAAAIAPKLTAGSIICLDGTLGAGKTHFVKALAKALGYPAEVSSPTFPLVHEYRWNDQVLIHMDFYRLENQEEIYAAGLEEHLPGEGITVVEWAQRFPGVFPQNTWHIGLIVTGENSREVTIDSPDH